MEEFLRNFQLLEVKKKKKEEKKKKETLKQNI